MPFRLVSQNIVLPHKGICIYVAVLGIQGAGEWREQEERDGWHVNQLNHLQMGGRGTCLRETHVSQDAGCGSDDVITGSSDVIVGEKCRRYVATVTREEVTGSECEGEAMEHQRLSTCLFHCGLPITRQHVSSCTSKPTLPIIITIIIIVQ